MHARRPEPFARRLALGALVALSAACGGTASVDAVTSPVLSAVPAEQIRDGMQQRVTLQPARPATGDTVAIRSVLVNRGSAPARIEHVVCGLDYDRNTVLANPFIMCLAYSATTTLAVGDSIVHVDRRVIAAGPGSYTIRVHHLVPPAPLAVDLPITVVAR